jgi:hypothetical protein
MNMYRQGDVLIFEGGSSAITLSHEEVLDRVLAYGEATGHAHRIVGAGAHLYASSEGGDMVLAVQTSARVVHEEHGAIDLPAGVYVVRRQREYAPDEVRIVED